MNNIRISPSILAADFAKLGYEVASATRAGADYIHVDVMDGMFVPNISFGFPIIKSIRPYTNLPLDVHMMVIDPIRYIRQTADAGADIITVHYEAGSDVQACIDLIHACGCKAGLAVSPGTPVEVLKEYIPSLEMVLVMTVEPGKGGQQYLPESTERVRTVRGYINEMKPTVHLEVDGGLNFRTVHNVLRAGADVIVAGTCIFRNYVADNISTFRGIFEFYENF